jgi:hypothetical protein
MPPRRIMTTGTQCRGLGCTIRDAHRIRASARTAVFASYVLESRYPMSPCSRCNCSTALHIAACEGHARIVEALLNAGADMNIKDR